MIQYGRYSNRRERKIRRTISMLMIMVFLLCLFGDYVPVIRKVAKVETAYGANSLKAGDYLYLKTSFGDESKENNWQKDEVYICARLWITSRSSNKEEKVIAEVCNSDYVRIPITQEMLNGEGSYIYWYRGNNDKSIVGSTTLYSESYGFHIVSGLDKNVFKLTAWSNGGIVDEWISNSETPSDNTVIPGSNSRIELDNDFKAKQEAGTVFAATATYFDYLSDSEHKLGWLNNNSNIINSVYDNEIWFPFTDLNSYISTIASNGIVKLPMYFGNLYKEGNQYGYSNEVNGLYNYNGDISTATDKAYYDVNNSNALSNYYQSIQGLAGAQLDADGDIVYAGTSVKMPYFNRNALTDSSNSMVYAKVIDSYFPFRVSTDKGYNEYSFNSQGATDNVYFNWNGTTPVSIGYGQGTEYGYKDNASKFGGTEDGYGIFPFNNSANTLGTRGGNNNPDYGFGIKIEIPFKVPKNGTVDGTESGLPVSFSFSGDDDMFVYFGEESGTKNLVLDLGGDHKKTSGSINFKNMTATVDDSYKSYADNSTNTLNVPANEIWVLADDDLGWDEKYLYAWDYSSGQVKKNFEKITESEGYYKLDLTDADRLLITDKNSWTSSTNKFFLSTFEWMTGNVDEPDISSFKGKTVRCVKGTPTFVKTKPTVTKVNNGHQLDPGKNYIMTVFYMERGLGESNFSVEYTMQPILMGFSTDKTIDAGNVADSIKNTLSEKEEFEYQIQKYNTTKGAYENLGLQYEKRTQASVVKPADNLLSPSNFKMKDTEEVMFGNRISVGTKLRVSELDTSSKNALIQYTPSWGLYDNSITDNPATPTDESLIVPGSGEHVALTSQDARTAVFSLYNSTDMQKDADLKLRYVNTLSTGDMKFTKQTKTLISGTQYNYASGTKEFTVKLLLNLGVDVVHEEGTTGFNRYVAPLYSTLDSTIKTNLVNAIKNGTYSSSDFTSQYYRIYEGIIYTITPSGGSEGAEQTLGSDGQITFKTGDIITIKNLPVGVGYLIVENEPESPYSIGTGVLDGTVSASSATTPVVLINNYTIPQITCTVTKEWQATSGYIGTVPQPESIQVQLQRKLTTEGESAFVSVGGAYTLKPSSDSWTHTFTGLDSENAAGIKYEYRVVELNGSNVIAEGGSITYGSNTYTVSYSNASSGDNYTSTITNTYQPVSHTTSIKITKVDAVETSTKLSGVTFTLAKEADTDFTARTLTTNSDGEVTASGLTDGTYTLTETKTNAGYSLLKSPITIVISRDSGVDNCTVDGAAVTLNGDTIELTVSNQPVYAFPPTGGIGADMFRFIGLEMILLSAMICMIVMKRGVCKR